MHKDRLAQHQSLQRTWNVNEANKKEKPKPYAPGGVKAFAAEYKEAHPKTDTELSKIVAAKLEEMRGMQ